jgi:hypothetical protein
MHTACDTAAMDGIVIIALAALALFFLAYATQWRRVDAPVNPPGRVRIRRNYQFWWQSTKSFLFPVISFVLGLILGLHWPER